MTKERVIETLGTLPDQFSIEELVEKLLFIDKVEQGIKQADEGKTISLDEAKKRLGVQ